MICVRLSVSCDTYMSANYMWCIKICLIHVYIPSIYIADMCVCVYIDMCSYVCLSILAVFMSA